MVFVAKKITSSLGGGALAEDIIYVSHLASPRCGGREFGTKLKNVD